MPLYVALMKCYLLDPCKITQTLLGAEVALGSVVLLVPVVWNKPLKESSVRSSANQIIWESNKMQKTICVKKGKQRAGK